MNILIVNTFNRGGGAERVAKQLFEKLKDRGIYVYFFAGYGESIEDGEVAFENKFEIKLNILKCVVQNNQPLEVAKSKNRLLDIIEKKKIDIVHFHNIHGNYMGIKDIVDITKKCKVVWTLHDMWAFTGHCAYAFDCKAWEENECKKCTTRRVYPAFYYNDVHYKFKLKQKKFIDNNITFVVPSMWLKNFAKISFLKNEDIRLIHNGVSLDEYKLIDKDKTRDKYSVQKNKDIIMFGAATMNNKFKGMEYIYSMLEKLSSKENYVLLVVGNGFLKEKVSDRYNIIEFGYVRDTDKMNEIYGMADIFVMPSLAENYPCTVLESMASGTPVLAFETGGIPEQINNDNGWIISEKSGENLANKIANIFIDKNKLKDKQSKCRGYIEKNNSEDKMINEYMSLFDSINSKKL